MLRIAGVIALALFALTACGRESEQGSGGGSDPEPAPTMPETTFSVSETDDELEVVLDATVVIEADGSWERTGDGPDSGRLTEDQVARIAELSEAPDFPEDPDNDVYCPAVMPSYSWALTVGEEKVTNGNGGCAFSDSAVEIKDIIQEAADLGPTL